jgi:hypothetical protein
VSAPVDPEERRRTLAAWRFADRINRIWLQWATHALDPFAASPEAAAASWAKSSAWEWREPFTPDEVWRACHPNTPAADLQILARSPHAEIAALALHNLQGRPTT